MPFRAVLHAAVANAFGRKALFQSDYEAYKAVRKFETAFNLQVILSLATKSKELSLSESLHKLAESHANPMSHLLFVKLAFLCWERFARVSQVPDHLPTLRQRQRRHRLRRLRPL